MIILKLSLLVNVLLLLMATVSMGQEASAPVWTQQLDAQLNRAADNRAELIRAMNSVPRDHRPALEFLIENMPPADLQSLSADYLCENIELSYRAINQFPWGKQVPDEVFLNYVLPYANVDETREAWREEMLERCSGIVADCKTATEATIKLNRELFPAINVRYGTSRRRANQSPSESIEQSVASCTGLSILLVDACRSVGVPARLVGVPSWTNKRGNHTWVEIWDGKWHFTGAAEPSAAGLNHAWFTHDASQADVSNPRNRIYAASFRRTDTVFPLVWNPSHQFVFAEDVTSRYTRSQREMAEDQARVMIRVIDQKSRERLECEVRISSEETGGESLQGKSKGETADTNDFLTFEIRQGANCRIVIRRDGISSEFQRTVKPEAQQLWEFEWSPPGSRR